LYFCVVFTQLKKGKMSYTYEYPHPAVAIDCVVFGFNGRALEILLIERGVEPFKGSWALPGGFMGIEETAEECAKRELWEETGFRLLTLKQLGAFTGVHRDPRERVVSIAFYALVQPSDVMGGDDARQAQWFPVDDAPPLAFDHDYILRKALRQLRKDIHFEPVGFELLSRSFTMSELQRLYEAILGVHFDRRNFEKKMLQSGILEQYDEEEESANSREFDYDASPEMPLSGSVACCAPPPAPKKRLFGDHNEMRRMDIGALFGTTTPEKTSEVEDTKRKPGRKGRKFLFNKEKYDNFKQDNNFRLEF
jgi:8-oxo-dGTP diphosphatase